jgi:hypothetical protein
MSIRSRLTFANVTSSVALFVALGTGGAYAANTIGSADVIDESLQSVDIKDGEVKTSDLRNSSVTSLKINNGSVLNAEIANNAVTSGKILDNSIEAADIGSGAVGADELGTVHEHFGPLTNIADVTAHDGSYATSTAAVSCGAGEDLLSATVDWTNSGGHNERNFVGVLSTDRGEPETAVVEVNYDGGATTASYQPVAYCLF